MLKRNKLELEVLVIFCAAATIAAGCSAEDDTIQWGQCRDISYSNLETILQPCQMTSAPSQESITVHFTVESANCSLYTTPAGNEFVYLNIDGLEPSTSPGEPQLPMKTIVIKLPREAEVVCVHVTSAVYRAIQNELNIVPMPHHKNAIYKPSETVYSLSTYFPGNAVTYDTGMDTENTYVYAHLWPVQYVPALKKAVMITDANVTVYYTLHDDAHRTVMGNSDTRQTLKDAECVIITPPEFYTEATSLQWFHVHEENITTEVVNTSWINNKYWTAQEPPYNGYKNRSNPGYNSIAGYDYDLSLRIISFLREHTNLDYVVLFGNARLVPPSYYWFDGFYYEGHEEKILTEYNAWIPTDFFYSSPDYDFTPDYAVGRLPVSDREEAAAVVDKIRNWYDGADWSWFKNVALAGGKPFVDNNDGWEFQGELQTSDTVNKNYLNGMAITKFYLTDDNYSKANVLEVLSGGYGLFYISTHGTGGMFVDRNHDNSELVLATISDIKSLLPNDKVPVVITDACDNGAFDTNVYYADFDRSVGEAIVNSDAGGIAYIGGSRVVFARADYCFNKGKVVITKEPQMAGLIHYVFENYHEGSGTAIGDITTAAMRDFAVNNVLTDPSTCNLRTILEFVLLGDPALLIPEQEQSGITYKKPDTCIGNCSEGIPVLCSGESVNLDITSDSPMVKIKVIDTGYTYPEFTFEGYDYLLSRAQKGAFNNHAAFTFTPLRRNRHLIRVESEDGKECRQYVDIAIGLGEALDDTVLTWSSGGNSSWFGQQSTYYYGGDAAQSGAIAHNQDSWIQTTVSGPGTITFYWKVSSQAGYDFLEFYIDDMIRDKITGGCDWQQRSYTLSFGSHRLRWRYVKDVGVYNGSDCGWLDKVEFSTALFDTGPGAYPSICGMHKGTITPNQTMINVSTLYTYPCTGTGGHTEYIRIWNSTLNATALWDGYGDDWRYVPFDKTFTLVANETYNYTIRTGSYPQIHHTPALSTASGWLNCTEFVDANGKRYDNWIPAIRLE